MKLLILLLVGLALAGGSAAYLFYGTGQVYPDKFYSVIPMAIGIALIMIAGSKFLKKANDYFCNLR